VRKSNSLPTFRNDEPVDEFAWLRRGYTDRYRKDQYDRTVSESGKAFNFAATLFNSYVYSGNSNIDPSFYSTAALAAVTVGMGVTLGNALKQYSAGESNNALLTTGFEILLEKPWFRKDIYRLIEAEQVNKRASVLDEIEAQFGKETLEVFMSLGLDQKHEFKLRCFKIVSTLAFGSIATLAVAGLTAASGPFRSAFDKRSEIDAQTRSTLVKSAVEITMAIPKKVMGMLKISEMRDTGFNLDNVRDGAPGFYNPISKALNLFKSSVGEIAKEAATVNDGAEIAQLTREAMEFDSEASGNRTDVRNLLTQDEVRKLDEIGMFIADSGKGIQNVDRLKTAITMAVLLRHQIKPYMLEKAKADDKRFFESKSPKLKGLDTAWNAVSNTIDRGSKALAQYTPFLPDDFLERYEATKKRIEDKKAFDKVVADQERLMQEKIKSAQDHVRIKDSPNKTIKMSIG